jgi:hypothetical protein
MEKQPDADWYEALSYMPDPDLRELGLRKWGRKGADPLEDDETKCTGQMLWLYPKEWYDRLPDGLPIVSISFQEENFKKGETDDDHRFGMLSFGFLSKLP